MAFQRFVYKIVTVTALILGVSVMAPVYSEQSTNSSTAAAMTVERQNAIVQKYCAVCHDDAHRNGGLSLQHFDASTVEPSLAVMMVSKLDTGAMGAAGIPKPDTATERAFYDALSAKMLNANEWRVARTENPVTRARLVTANIVREVPARADGTKELYRIELTCRPDTGEAQIQLTWSPMSAQGRRDFSVALDGHEPVTFSIEGRESMGNGAKAADGKDVVSGSAAAVLYRTALEASAPSIGRRLPAGSLSVSNVFPGETVVFPFDQLKQPMRQELSGCF
jgi:hypothetical protein